MSSPTYRLRWTVIPSADIPTGAHGRLQEEVLQPLCHPKAQHSRRILSLPQAVVATSLLLAENDVVAEGEWLGKNHPTLAQSTVSTMLVSLSKICPSSAPFVLEPSRPSTNGSGTKTRCTLFERPGSAAIPKAHLCNRAPSAVRCILTIPTWQRTSTSNADPNLKPNGHSTVATISSSICTTSTSQMPNTLQYV